MKAVIIGAGIGGLTTAIALQEKGIEPLIFEAAGELTTKGAGILIPPNAMAVLDQYNLTEQIQSMAQPIQAMQILNNHGQLLSSSPTLHEYQGQGFQTHAIHRGRLQQILLSKVSKEAIKLDYKCQKLVFRGNQAIVDFQNGYKQAADLVIGADGLRSKIRHNLFHPRSPEKALRYSGQICWRGIASIELKENWQHRLTEVWGRGTRFGFVQIAPGEIYWYATQHQKVPFTERVDLATLQKTFKHYVSPVQDILASTPENKLIQDHIYDLDPLATWSLNRAVLLGDAAHATTPNLGQGGAQAIEDAFALAQALTASRSSQSDIEKAFTDYELARRSKVDKVVQASWQIGQVTNLSNPIACYMRNTAVKHMSKRMLQRSTKQIYAWP